MRTRARARSSSSHSRVVVVNARACALYDVDATNTNKVVVVKVVKKKRTEEEEVLLLCCVREISTARQSAVPSRHSERVRAIRTIGVRTARDARLRRQKFCRRPEDDSDDLSSSTKKLRLREVFPEEDVSDASIAFLERDIEAVVRDFREFWIE